MVYVYYLLVSCCVNWVIRFMFCIVNNNIVEFFVCVSGVNLVMNMVCDDGVYC